MKVSFIFLVLALAGVHAVHQGVTRLYRDNPTEDDHSSKLQRHAKIYKHVHDSAEENSGSDSSSTIESRLAIPFEGHARVHKHFIKPHALLNISETILDDTEEGKIVPLLNPEVTLIHKHNPRFFSNTSESETKAVPKLAIPLEGHMKVHKHEIKPHSLLNISETESEAKPIIGVRFRQSGKLHKHVKHNKTISMSDIKNHQMRRGLNLLNMTVNPENGLDGVASDDDSPTTGKPSLPDGNKPGGYYDGGPKVHVQANNPVSPGQSWKNAHPNVNAVVKQKMLADLYAQLQGLQGTLNQMYEDGNYAQAIAAQVQTEMTLALKQIAFWETTPVWLDPAAYGVEPDWSGPEPAAEDAPAPAPGSAELRAELANATALRKVESAKVKEAAVAKIDALTANMDALTAGEGVSVHSIEGVYTDTDSAVAATIEAQKKSQKDAAQMILDQQKEQLAQQQKIIDEQKIKEEATLKEQKEFAAKEAVKVSATLHGSPSPTPDVAPEGTRVNMNQLGSSIDDLLKLPKWIG